MLIQDQEYPQCEHIKVNGVRCGSPSLHDRDFCYFHNRARRVHVSPSLPVLEDGNALQYAISEILQAALEDRIDLKKASTLIYGLQVAAYNLRTGGVNFEPYRTKVVRTDPAEEFYVEAMKKLPEKATTEQVLSLLKIVAKG